MHFNLFFNRTPVQYSMVTVAVLQGLQCRGTHHAYENPVGANAVSVLDIQAVLSVQKKWQSQIMCLVYNCIIQCA